MLHFGKYQVIRVVRRSIVCRCGMASSAENLPMTPGEFEVGLVMVETGSAFPGIERVALTAFGSKLPAVLIGVTAQAVPRKPQKSPGRILLP